jgi:threonine dehydratase
MPELTLLPDLATIRDASRHVYDALTPTPQIRWPQLEAAAGTEVWVKHENHQPVGAFKLRGGLVYMEALRRREPHVTTVISATRGNHGQSIAIAARKHGLRAVIVVPHGNSVEKNAAMRSQGAELIEHGDDYQASMDHAMALAAEHGWHMIPSVHRDLVLGVATLHLELLEVQPRIATLYVPVGMGSSICGAIAVRDGLGLATEIVGVTSTDARATVLSVAAGHVVEAPVSARIADGVSCRKPNAEAVEAMRKGVARFVEVSDAKVAEAMRLYFAATHNVAEGAGALGLAALLMDIARKPGSAAVILSGGNVDTTLYSQVLSRTV